jgi:hypothetical protein
MTFTNEEWIELYRKSPDKLVSFMLDVEVLTARNRSLIAALEKISKAEGVSEFIDFEKSKEMAQYICDVTDIATDAL